MYFNLEDAVITELIKTPDDFNYHLRIKAFYVISPVNLRLTPSYLLRKINIIYDLLKQISKEDLLIENLIGLS